MLSECDPSGITPKTWSTCCGQRKIATMSELKEALGTQADATVFRKLESLAYRTSYSHRGRYYTLEEIARFNELGLWSFRSVWFSRFGTLLSTVEALVAASRPAMTPPNWRACARRGKAPLLEAVRAGRLARQQGAGRYVYLSADPSLRRQQLAARQVYDATPDLLGLGPGCGRCPRRSRRPSCCSTACSTNASGDCMPGWRPSRSATAVTPRSPSCWGSMLTPWPEAAVNF